MKVGELHQRYRLRQAGPGLGSGICETTAHVRGAVSPLSVVYAVRGLVRGLELSGHEVKGCAPRGFRQGAAEARPGLGSGTRDDSTCLWRRLAAQCGVCSERFGEVN